MFPKLWGATGLAYDELLGRLVQLGLDRHEERASLKTDYGR
jgi:D-alanine-D-alanine ligase